MTIGSLNLTMLNLPNGNDGSTFGLGQRFEHYGIVVGSTVNAAETLAFNGYQSKAIFDNMNIKMQSTNNGWNVYPLLAGIRVIQGAGGNSGNGSAGYVEVKNDLAIDINATSNDAIGIYISGSEHNGVVPEVHLNNSNIKIKSTSSRANAIRLGKTASIGTGEGRLFSTGHMEIDTLQAANDAAIDIIWQGAVLDANADTSSTTISAGREAITISGNASQATAQTVTSFNDLVATTASTTANLINVANNQNDYRLNIRGVNSDLKAASAGWLLNVNGTVQSPSAVTFNVSDGKITGLVNKAAPSTLEITVQDGAQWIMQEKGGATPSTTATFTQLNIANAAILDATAGAGALSDFVLQGNVLAETAGEIRLYDGTAGDRLTINGSYTGNGGLMVMSQNFYCFCVLS